MATAVNNQKQVTARLGDLHISPRKVRLVTDLIKKKSVASAQTTLRFVSKKAARPILKLLNSAVANAAHNFGMNVDSLFVKDIFVNTGQVFRRFMPRAQGRAFPIKKRTSIVELTLATDPKAKLRQAEKSVKAKPPDTLQIPKSKLETPQDEKAIPRNSEKLDEQLKKKRPAGETRKGFWKGPLNLKRRLFNRKTNA
ncbi:MAG: 50S ribosomal protein L22 [Candidatus Doudnabacteria bacterium]|nr:50S ribosomal protein L22 [Candidatus Doudnabacteria bacterium]